LGEPARCVEGIPLSSVRAVARCFVTRRLPGRALERLAGEHKVDLWEDVASPPPRDELLARAHDAEGLLSMLTDRIDADLLDDCPRLRAIANYAVGWDNVDVEAATARGIPVGNTPDVLTDATADLAWTLLLASARGIASAADAVRRGEWRTWRPDGWLGHDVHGMTLGIVGMGRIGGAVARRAEGFDMEVVHTSRHGGVGVDELLERSDFVSLHVPLTPETRGLIGDVALRRMKPTAHLVNTARGPLVDQAALVRALREGWIAGAALDVTDPEPLPADHPLLSAPNLLVVPHIGSATHRTRAAMADLAVDNLLATLRGERMPHCVNPEVYGR
jgi:glyoxylate reductase